ncbi:MAG: hypothetical protein PHT41_04225 [Candidatus Omnitrophica bacterium]|nr:hypothetical protein [Candidatus Omnitrophota bacterium]MDD5237538.1 hypothetical protein [Candidatus Omnitrophota bacterium]
MNKADKKYSCLGNFVKFIFVALAALIFIELFLRLFMPLHFTAYTKAYQYDKELGYRAAPGHWLKLTDYKQEFYVNKLGTINFQDDFKGYKYLVFALGDSFTQGTGLPSDANYPFQLDLMLNLDSGGRYVKKFGVVNLGLAAFGAEQSLITLKRYIEIIGKPLFVLYLGAENDYSDDLLFRLGSRHKNIVKDSPYYGRLYYPLSFFVYDLEIGKRINYFVRERIIRARAKKIECGSSVAELEIGPIREIVKIAQENGAYVILSWSNAGDSYNWLKSWSGKNGVAFADWIPAVDSVADAMPCIPTLNPHSGGHYRTWVNNAIAGVFAREINRQFSRGIPK